MSSDKKPDPSHSQVFSINFEDDDAVIPGVTQLLNPKQIRETHEKKSRPLPNAKPETPVLSTEKKDSGPSLAECGVQFELHFEMERGIFRYTRMKAHARPSLALWQQKFYFQMKFDLKALAVTKSFQEFEKDKDFFQADALGLSDASYLQIIRQESSPNTVYVLLSEKSLLASEELVRGLLSRESMPTSQDGGDDEFKIELAS